MNDKKEQLAKRIEILIEYTFATLEQYIKGQITEEQLEDVLVHIDSSHEEIEYEVAKFELLDNICLN